MLLIGTQIRLTRAVMAAAVHQRRAALIQNLARQQVEAGANWLLVDVGPQRKNAADDLAWLVRTIHQEVTVPLALRSDDPAALEAGLMAARDMTLVDATLPGVTDVGPYLALAKRHNSRIALTACPGGLPLTTEERVLNATQVLIPRALEAGLPLENLYVDPMVAALTCDQPKVPATVETLQLLKVAADPVPNTLIHLDDIADGVAEASRPVILQAYVTMLLAAGLDALAANTLDPDLVDVLRIIRDRDPSTPADRLLLRLFDATKAGVELDATVIDAGDPAQVALFKTVQVLTNRSIYADAYLLA